MLAHLKSIKCKYSKGKHSKCLIARWLVMVVLSGQNGREPATDRLRGGIWKSHPRLLLRWLRRSTREQLIKICDAEIFVGKDDKLYTLCLLPLNYVEPDWTLNVAFCQTAKTWSGWAATANSCGRVFWNWFWNLVCGSTSAVRSPNCRVDGGTGQ